MRKMAKTIISLLLPCFLLFSCGSNDPAFKEEWTYSETHHWHESTRSGDDSKDNYSKHTWNAEGVCSVCGYVAVTTYPIITKMTNKIASGDRATEYIWADDYSSVTLKEGDFLECRLRLNRDGYVISEDEMDGSEFITMYAYTYEGNLITSKTTFEDGEISLKEVYEYNADNKPLRNLFYKYENQVEQLYKKVDYEYFSGYSTETTSEYDEDLKVLVFASLDKWTVTTEGENTKYTLERKGSGNDTFELIGYILYNKHNQIIERKEIQYNKSGNYYKHEYISYTESGDISTLLTEYDNNAKDASKYVYSYDENDFIVDMKVYLYNATTSEYDNLTRGCDYTVDSKGTVIRAISYNILSFPGMGITARVDYSDIEYEVKYYPVKFKIDIEDFTAETKGLYGQSVLEPLRVLGVN